MTNDNTMRLDITKVGDGVRRILEPDGTVTETPFPTGRWSVVPGSETIRYKPNRDAARVAALREQVAAADARNRERERYLTIDWRRLWQFIKEAF